MNKIKPNLFIPGAGKSGTSSLHNYLKLHPEIFMSELKEPHFFSHDEKYFSKEQAEKYFGLFKKGKGSKYRGESSTGYLVFPNAIERIKNDIEDPKFIVLLRNPIDRIFSHYNWVDSLIGEKLSFEDTIRKDMLDEPDPNYKFGLGYRYYYQAGLYGKWLKRLYKEFDKRNILIILTEDLKDNPLKVINKCCNFLDISKLDNLEVITTNKTVYYRNSNQYHKILESLNLPLLSKFRKYKLTAPIHKLLQLIKNNIVLPLTNIYFKENNPKILSEVQRKWLRDLYKEDFVILKELTGLKYTKWEDFN